MSLTAFVSGLAAPSCPLPRHGEDRLFRAVELAREFLRRRHDDHIKESMYSPLLITYGSDCTPVRTRQVVRGSFGETRIVLRPVQPGEWLIQRKFVHDTMNRMTVLFGELRRMQQKSAWGGTFRPSATWRRPRGSSGIPVSSLCTPSPTGRS